MSSSTGQDIISKRLNELLDGRAYPKTICPSEVARSLSSDELQQCNAESWRDLMPQIREIAWKLKEKGELDVMQKGEIVDQNLSLEDVRGPIRLRRRQNSQSQVE